MNDSSLLAYLNAINRNGLYAQIEKLVETHDENQLRKALQEKYGDKYNSEIGDDFIMCLYDPHRRVIIMGSIIEKYQESVKWYKVAIKRGRIIIFALAIILLSITIAGLTNRFTGAAMVFSEPLTTRPAP